MSGISTTSGVSPAETMVANFSKAWFHGSEMISTLVPGLASSNVLTMPFSVSVRSGLVITSTSFSVVSARAVPAMSSVDSDAIANILFMKFPFPWLPHEGGVLEAPPGGLSVVRPVMPADRASAPLMFVDLHRCLCRPLQAGESSRRQVS
ncbi:hypothetical protein KL86PLE_40799 [uncultured Pleomorphomonas sp.]|uniref:Uncharacterized protein n=1 Tax=uncultured Pleomorphomonas sp. TaxID=442121 RepID=A0A212LHE7_9HYPH|nr:hypothetical protein KL86PLE_40799 [uncultured Pleomorphomonas sp.]